MSGDLSFVLIDANALAEAAGRAGITNAKATRLAAALADLPPEQIVRLCATAQRVTRTEEERMRRKAEGRVGR